MITLVKTSNNWLLQPLLSGIAIALASMPASSTPLNLAQTPLFVTTSVKPNIMLMLDNSGSMSNIVPDTPYDPNTTYIASCPTANLVPAGTSVDIRIDSSQPKIRYSSTNYVWGTGTGQKCFGTATIYGARLNADGGTAPSSYLDAEYNGNYLNWYFNAGNTTPAWTTQQNKPGTQSRIEIARTSAKNLVDSLGNVRLGLSTYNSGNGGSLREIIGDVDDAKKTSVKTKIDALTASGNTPLAETLSDIGRYFATGYTGNLTLHPGQSGQTTPSVDSIFNSHNLSNNSGQTIANPIQNSCQKSFAVLMTDGRPQGDRAISSSLRDYTGDCAASPSQCDSTSNSTSLPSLPITNTGSTSTCDSSNRNFLACKNGTKAGRTYESEGSDYLDDVAKGLFEMDLRPDLVDSNGVKNNLTTYTIGFADTTVANDPLLIDAATRGGGLFLTAENSNQLTTAFQDALTDITSKNQSAAAVAANSTHLDTSTLIYQAKFDATDWSGELLAMDVNTTTGAVNTATPNWQASQKLPAHGSRNIYTYNPAAAAGARGILFQWANLTKDTDSPTPPLPSQQTYLNTLNGVVDTAKGTLRLDWLRGDKTNEKISDADTITNPTHIFRKRTNVLGDIINSDPVFVGTQNYGYGDGALPSPEGSDYDSFRSNAAYKNRRPVIYVGANDGMLHGFDARENGSGSPVVTSGGTEVFAYIPNALFPKLSKLTDPNYTHQYYVDGVSSVGDAYIDLDNNGTKEWHTLLAGTTGAGGRAVFALDVTYPDSFGASSALWEFTNADDGDLGYTLAQPSIVRMKNGSWAVIVANGYNSDNGRAVLFILDAKTGSVVKKIDTGIGDTTTPNGLSTALPVDIDDDRIIDYVYAGDLYGNLWKFDVSSGTASSWDVAYKAGTVNKPLFTACTAIGTTCTAANRQPITSKPNAGQVGTGQTSGLMIYFGTGKYFEVGDNNVSGTPQVQTFYGLWDKNTGNISNDQITDRDNLQAQTIDFEGYASTKLGAVGTSLLRVTSNNAVCYATTNTGCTSSSPLKQGWALNLIKPTNIIQGERVVSSPVVRRGLVIFATLTPSSDPCNSGGTGWLMEMDALTGKRPGAPAFDIFGGTGTAPTTTADGKVDDADYVKIDNTSNTYTSSGVNVGIGFHKGPAIVESDTVDYKKLSGSTGQLGGVTDAGGGGGGGGGSGARKSWRQLR